VDGDPAGRQRTRDCVRQRAGRALLALILLSPTGAGHAFQDPAPPLTDLPQYHGELAQIVGGLDDATLREFAHAVRREEEQRRLDLSADQWDAVLARLVTELERRPALRDTSVDLAWHRGAALVAENRFGQAREVLERVVERAGDGHERLGWIHTSMAQLEFAEEHWIDSRQWLERAERELRLERACFPDALRTWLDSMQAEYWVQIGMPELARDWIERSWSSAQDEKDPLAQWTAFDVYLNYLLVANDYTGLADLERALTDSGWLKAWNHSERDRASMRFALGLVEQGVSSAEPNRLARERLEVVLSAGRVPRRERAWALVALGLASLDGGDVDRAASAAAELRTVLGELGTLDLARPENTVAPRLIALEGLVALARHARGSIEPAELLARLEDASRAWSSLRAGWANAPTRDGGIGYLFLSQRQILVEALIGLQRAVLGEERGALAAFQWLTEAQRESTLARRLGVSRAEFDALRVELLDERTALLAWIPLRGRSYALAAHSRGARMFELAGVDRLEACARDLAGAVQAALSEDDPAARARLSSGLEAARDAFLPPALEAWLEPFELLYLMGLDDVGFVPFEMLPAADASTQGARRAVSRLPSLPLAPVLTQRAAGDDSSGSRVLTMLADHPDPRRARAHGVEDLRPAAGLVRDFVQALEVDERLELRGKDASWSELERALDSSFDLLHVVAHGIQRVHERPPGILLAEDSERTEVFAEEIETLRSPRLVLLSVCGAARSRLRRGDSARSDLGAAFLLAGAAATASSFSDLDLGPTLRVDARVHEELSRGATLAEALRTTRLELCGASTRLGRDWIAAHVLQVGGAGLSARLWAPAGDVRSAAAPHAWSGAIAAAVGTLAIVLLAARVIRRSVPGRTSARDPRGSRADVRRARDERES
jgi:hypothetical protein